MPPLTRSMLRNLSIGPCKGPRVNWDKMFAATRVRNYILKDPIIDWLRHIKMKPRGKPFKSSKFTNKIYKDGHLFEDEVYKYFDRMFQVVKIGDSFDARSFRNFIKTKKAMEAGAEVIYQGVLHDYEGCTYGCPDFMIRSDRLNSIFGKNLITTEEEKLGSPLMNLPYHYIIVDIKHSVIKLKADGEHILNQSTMPANKGQLYVYTKCLGSIQGYEPEYAFVLGKKIEGKSIYSENFMDCVGKISYSTVDKNYKIATNEALVWLNEVATHGKKWSYNPPSHKNLYPNMNNRYDDKWRSVKQKICDEIKEISGVWECGPIQRDLAHSKGIMSWDDPRCTSSSLGFNPGWKASALDAILFINRDPDNNITFNLRNDNWKELYKENKPFYLDFESFDEYIFMIGIGWEEDGKWCYRCFYTVNKSDQEEKRNFIEFIDFVHRLSDNPLFIHWSNYEKTNFFRLIHKHKIHLNTTYQFHDLCDFFKGNQIAVKGAMNYSIKSIAKAMKNHGLIDSIWKESDCMNGLDAMYMSQNLYNRQKTITGKEKLFKQIRSYNQIDCKVMYEMVSYFMKN